MGLQVQAIADIGDVFHHSIKLVEPAIPEQASTWRYTCYMHAFELQPPPGEVAPIARSFDRVFPNSAFVSFLIDHHLEEVNPTDVSNGDVVVYSIGAVPKHAGKAHSGAVLSKWGTGHPWHHRLFELPTRHGNVVRFFRGLRREDSGSAFLEYARQCLGENTVNHLLGQGA